MQVAGAAGHRIVEHDEVTSLVGLADGLALVGHPQVVHLAAEAPLQAQLQRRHEGVHLLLGAAAGEPGQQDAQRL